MHPLVFLSSPERVGLFSREERLQKEHLFVSSIIHIGRGVCKVTPAMPTWGLSPERGAQHLCELTPRLDDPPMQVVSNNKNELYAVPLHISCYSPFSTFRGSSPVRNDHFPQRSKQPFPSTRMRLGDWVWHWACMSLGGYLIVLPHRGTSPIRKCPPP